MLAILELPDKTAHKGLSCFSSNKVASKQHQRRHQWRPPSRRLARWLAPYHGTTAACGSRCAPPLRLRAYQPARSNWRYGEYTLYRSTDSTDYTSPQRHACTRIAAHTAFTAAQTPTNPAASHQYARAERHLTPRVADDAGISLG